MEKTPRILHVSTHHEPCGIGKFQERCVEALNQNGESVNDFYPLSLNKIKVLNNEDRKKELLKIVNTAQEYNIVHIQHEFGFFYKTGLGFGELVEAIKESGIPVIVTIHTAPELLLSPKQLNSKTPKGIAGYLRRNYKNNQTIKHKVRPFSRVDKIITFNSFTRDQLVNIAGANPANIFKTMLPVPYSSPTKNSQIRTQMNAKKDDVILCTSGFINQFKGFDHAIKALKYLPDNYKLAILGGINPDSGNPAVYDQLCDLVISLGLEKRVYISGYIEDDGELSALMQGCDIALYPYNVEYYRLASSDAINKAISCHVPIVAYPTASFKEINDAKNDVLMLTNSPNYYELTKSILKVDKEKLIANEKEYIGTYNYQQAATDLLTIYREVLSK